MKKSLFLLLPFFFAACTGTTTTPVKDSPSKDSVTATPPATGYDSVLAKEVGADEYGMRQYVMAFLKAGPTPEKDSVKREALQKQHLANINRMAKAGQLSVAGPFMDDTGIRGIYIFNVATVEEAKKLTETDPLIQSGGLVMELHPWYGSAALMKVFELHGRVAKKSIF